VFLNYFDILILKIIFKNSKKYYFNIFLNKNILKNNQKQHFQTKHPYFTCIYLRKYEKLSL